MKNLYTLLVALIISFSINAQNIDIPDANFKNALVNTNCVDSEDIGIGVADADTNDDGEISVAEAEAVNSLILEFQSISSLVGIEYFINLINLNCKENELTELTLSTLSNLNRLECDNNQLTELNITNSPLTTLYCDNNELTILDLNSLTNLEFLRCENNLLTEIDLGSSINLHTIRCGFNNLSDLELSNSPNLFNLDCESNLLSSLDFSGQNSLSRLDCSNNYFTSLDLSNLTNLEVLECSQNQLTSLNLEDFTNLYVLECEDNMLNSITFPDTGQLDDFNCSNNQLTTLDLSNNSGSFYRLNATNNQLTTLFIKNGIYDIGTLDGNFFGVIDVSNNPNLTYVCADADELSDIDLYIMEPSGIANYTINSYCSFVPGGKFYSIEGNTRIDLDNNGCDTNDAAYSNLNFEITNGLIIGNIISNTTGEYSITVQEDTYTITPNLENPEYFTVTPSNIIVDFPADVNPYMQDFCITPNGVFNDLEITIIPLGAARPGFDTNYKVIYKNKGNTTLSGNINFGFEDEVMDFVASTPPNESGLTDLLNWSFTDLAPFETRVIDVTMNLNSPMETPPLNDGDNLTFITSISSSETDETPDDNTFELNQTVVNAFDPNDKTCLEGAFITPEMVGEYVHYMIRFENTGSASAVNIVVKDDIDVSKYDLSSLVPLHASHNFVARINNENNYIEFIFENINLPYDDANNDGFIVFKIKTLDTLELNDTFENDAEIYFDFNFPIITNNESTTVGTLSVDEFELANNTISLYPNPTTHILNLESEQPIKQIAIYDISGRRVKEIAFTGVQTVVNISTEALSIGTYFVNIKTIQGETVRKVIKY